MLQIERVKLELEEDESLLRRRAAAALRIPEAEVLEVRVLLTEEGYAIQRWATAYAGGWEADDTITIWDGF